MSVDRARAQASMQGTRHRISIALATYNGATFLQEQLESLAGQTLVPDELVVCDDQSSDATVEILHRFALRAPFPVHVRVNDERLGWRGNFVEATGLCSHDLVAFCDQDDVWYPGKLETIVREFDDPSVMLVHHNADLVDPRGEAYGTLQPVTTEKRIIEALSRPTHWSNPLGLTMVFRAVLARYNDLWPESIDLAVPGHRAAHDQWFYFLATNLGTVISLPQRLLGYRQHQGNSVGWNDAPASRPRIDDAQAVAVDTDRILKMLRPFCAVLHKAAEREGELASAFIRSLEKNLALMRRLERRRRLYDAPMLVSRVGIVADLIRRGDYSQRHDWGLGSRALLTDLTSGVLHGGAGSSRDR